MGYSGASMRTIENVRLAIERDDCPVLDRCGLGKGTDCDLCAVILDRYEQLEKRLVSEALAKAQEPLEKQQMKWAAQEASAAAWTTSVPLLVLPQLLEEKVDAAREQAKRQRQIRVRTQAIAALAE